MRDFRGGSHALMAVAFALALSACGSKAAGPGANPPTEVGVVTLRIQPVTLTAERADTLADELSERGGIRRDEARALIEDLLSRWRGDAARLGERAGAGLSGVFREVGLVTQSESATWLFTGRVRWRRGRRRPMNSVASWLPWDARRGIAPRSACRGGTDQPGC